MNGSVLTVLVHFADDGSEQGEVESLLLEKKCNY